MKLTLGNKAPLVQHGEQPANAFTDEEAKHQWCPMYRAPVTDGSSPGNEAAGCRGSACMMWRTLGKRKEEATVGNGDRLPDGPGWTSPSGGVPYSGALAVGYYRTVEVGTCGLAGPSLATQEKHFVHREALKDAP